MPNIHAKGSMVRSALLVLAVLATAVTEAAPNCARTEEALSYWRPVRQDISSSTESANAFALELVSCLGSRNAELRDRIGYEIYAHWLRNDLLDTETRKTLVDRLSTHLNAQLDAGPDEKTLLRSFSALILAELMRSDATNSFLAADERQRLLQTGISSLEHENDYRGLDPDIGWVHPVAHLSDLLWRFALHPDTTAAQATSILAGLRGKIGISVEYYHFNEPDRLARIASTLIRKGMMTPESVVSWLGDFERPISMERWSNAFQSPDGMAELHNTKLFLRALSDQLHEADVDPSIEGLLDELVKGFTQLI